MNAFANWLFSIMLGWTRALANGLWNAVVNNAGGISDFFSAMWLPLIVVLLVAGTAFDYIVWLARWQPHRVWQSSMMRRRHEKQLAREARRLEQSDMPDNYLNMISNWVTTDSAVYDDNDPAWQDAAPYQHDTSYAQTAYPAMEQETPYQAYNAYAPAPQGEFYMPPDEKQVFDSPYLSTHESTPEPKQHSAAHVYEWFPENQRPHPGYPADIPPPREITRRRRRSDRRRSAGVGDLIGSIRDRLSEADEGATMLDGLPPPVSQEEAFQPPVYPQNYIPPRHPADRQKQQHQEP